MQDADLVGVCVRRELCSAGGHFDRCLLRCHGGGSRHGIGLGVCESDSAQHADCRRAHGSGPGAFQKVAAGDLFIEPAHVIHLSLSRFDQSEPIDI
jgi:hypothetical protein